MTNTIEISEDAFAAIFRPIANHLNPNASFDWGAGYGTLFETFGDELDYVRAHDASTVWTYVSGDDGDYITSGFHLVNRLGYFVSHVPVPEGTDILVELDSLQDDSVHRQACLLESRAQAVLADREFVASHRELDIECTLFGILGEARMAAHTFRPEHVAKPLTLVRERLDHLSEVLSEYEAEREAQTSITS